MGSERASIGRGLPVRDGHIFSSHLPCNPFREMGLAQLMRCAIYARVSTTDQDCSLQLTELRHYVKARGWELAGEYVDTGWAGGQGSRPPPGRLKRHPRGRTRGC